MSRTWALALLFGLGLLPISTLAGLSVGLSERLTLEHDGRTRRYDVYIPGGSGPFPLVVDMHAFGFSTGDQRAVSGFRELADRSGFIVAWPDGGGAWNPTLGADGFSGATRNDDVGFIRRMVDAIAEQVAVDRERVYATGWSKGGEMAQALACAATDVFAASAPLAAAFPAGFDDFCAPARPMPILMFRSDNDQIVPYSGGTGTQLNISTISASATLNFWRQENGCTRDTRSENPGSATHCDYHESCDAGATAGLCTIRSSGDQGHRVYQTVDGVRPVELAWAFFNKHRLPEGVETPSDDFAINAGLAGAWFNPDTPGQGLLIEPIPSSNQLFAAWFTFDETSDKLGDPDQRWFTLQGLYDGAGADLEIYAIRGGVFATPSEVETVPVGAARMEFSDCTTGSLEYMFDDGPSGTIALRRLTPDTLCGASKAGLAVEAELPKGTVLNEGLSGAWYDPLTAGQGMLFDVVPGSDLVFMAWFTFEAGAAGKLGEPANRWLTGQGSAVAPVVELILTNTSGGLFDDPATVTQEPAGEAQLTFSSCTSATLSYTIPADGVTGEISLIRLAPDVFCGDLSAR